MRLFLAIHPPPETAAALASLLTTAALPDHRPTAPAAIHCTVLFLGERGPRELDEILEGAAACCAGLAPFELRPLRLRCLPERDPRRTVVVECDRPATLLQIHDRAARRFARSPSQATRERFLPHLTVARFPGAGVAAGLDAEVDLPPFEVDAVTLMSSVLRPAGAEHRAVGRFALDRRR